MSAADEARAAALTDFIEDWYDRTVDPAHAWVARDLAEAIVEWQASQPITDEEVEAAKDAVRRVMRDRTYDEHAYDDDLFEEGVADIARAALEAARGVQS